jgi:hypothetical protein
MNIILHVLSNKYCSGCPLFESKEHIYVRNETLKMNAKYIPETIKILFVAESPPWAFTNDRTAYFYAPGEKIAHGGLGYYMIPILFKEKIITKEQFLQKFKESGFCLIDMVKCPINKLTKVEKEKAIKSCAKYLNEELHSLNFGKAIFIGKSSFRIIKNHLNLDFNYAVIPLPFGSNKNVEGFKEGLKRALS